MAARIGKASQQITDMSLLDVSDRIIKILWNMGNVVTNQGNKVSILSKMPTHRMVASMVGSSREVISRAFKMLVGKGLIAKDSRGLVIITGVSTKL